MGTISESVTAKPSIADCDDFSHSLREIPKDYSNVVFIRKRKSSDANLPKHMDEGIEVARMEDLRVVAIRGKFNFVNYNNILRKLKTIFGGQEVGAGKGYLK